jgi:uncharacterized protein
MTEKIKSYLGIAVIIGVLAISYASISYVGTYSKQGPTSYRTFWVNGEGKVTAIPDVASFSFSVTTEGGQNITDLQNKNTDKVNKAIDFVKSKGVEDKDVETQNYNVTPRYQSYNCNIYYGATTNVITPCPPSEIVGYTISQTVSVKIRDFKKVGDILAGVVSAGANTVSQLSFIIDDPDAFQNQAREEAISKAREKALGIAKSGGFKLGKLISITENGPTPYAYGLGGDAYAGISLKESFSTPPRIEPGSQEVQVNVTLQYEIE